MNIEQSNSYKKIIDTLPASSHTVADIGSTLYGWKASFMHKENGNTSLNKHSAFIELKSVIRTTKDMYRSCVPSISVIEDSFPYTFELSNSSYGKIEDERSEGLRIRLFKKMYSSSQSSPNSTVHENSDNMNMTACGVSYRLRDFMYRSADGFKSDPQEVVTTYNSSMNHMSSVFGNCIFNDLSSIGFMGGATPFLPSDDGYGVSDTYFLNPNLGKKVYINGESTWDVCGTNMDSPTPIVNTLNNKSQSGIGKIQFSTGSSNSRGVCEMSSSSIEIDSQTTTGSIGMHSGEVEGMVNTEKLSVFFASKRSNAADVIVEGEVASRGFSLNDAKERITIGTLTVSPFMTVSPMSNSSYCKIAVSYEDGSLLAKVYGPTTLIDEVKKEILFPSGANTDIDYVITTPIENFSYECSDSIESDIAKRYFDYIRKPNGDYRCNRIDDTVGCPSYISPNNDRFTVSSSTVFRDSNNEKVVIGVKSNIAVEISPGIDVFIKSFGVTYVDGVESIVAYCSNTKYSSDSVYGRVTISGKSSIVKSGERYSPLLKIPEVEGYAKVTGFVDRMIDHSIFTIEMPVVPGFTNASTYSVPLEYDGFIYRISGYMKASPSYTYEERLITNTSQRNMLGNRFVPVIYSSKGNLKHVVENDYSVTLFAGGDHSKTICLDHAAEEFDFITLDMFTAEYAWKIDGKEYHYNLYENPSVIFNIDVSTTMIDRSKSKSILPSASSGFNWIFGKVIGAVTMNGDDKMLSYSDVTIDVLNNKTGFFEPASPTLFSRKTPRGSAITGNVMMISHSNLIPAKVLSTENNAWKIYLTRNGSEKGYPFVSDVGPFSSSDTKHVVITRDSDKKSFIVVKVLESKTVPGVDNVSYCECYIDFGYNSDGTPYNPQDLFYQIDSSSSGKSWDTVDTYTVYNSKKNDKSYVVTETSQVSGERSPDGVSVMGIPIYDNDKISDYISNGFMTFKFGVRPVSKYPIGYENGEGFFIDYYDEDKGEVINSDPFYNENIIDTSKLKQIEFVRELEIRFFESTSL